MRALLTLTSMAQSLESILCTRCGLCCGGSLFADVELSGAEAARLEFAGLEIEDDSLLLQPCAALKGRKCSIYSHRPKCCRTFECLLLQQAKRGEISIVAATHQIDATLHLVKRVHALLDTMPETDRHLPLKERCVEAWESAGPTDTATELEAAIASLEANINQVFLQNPNFT
jgi:hypothetical protein